MAVRKSVVSVLGRVVAMRVFGGASVVLHENVGDAMAPTIDPPQHAK
jgi:hypothetical protein